MNFISWMFRSSRSFILISIFFIIIFGWTAHSLLGGILHQTAFWISFFQPTIPYLVERIYTIMIGVLAMLTMYYGFEHVFIRRYAKQIAIQNEKEKAYQSLLDEKISIEKTNDALKHQIKRQEEQIKSLEIAYYKITQKSKEVYSAKEIAERANKAKSDFLANISHELRTPLNGILGFAQLSLMNKNMTPEFLKAFKGIKQCGDHLLMIIQDILDITAIESGVMTIKAETFSTKELVASTLQVVQEEMIKKGLVVKNHVPDLLIRTDKSKLRQIILNLLSNAVKFTHEGFISISMNFSEDRLICTISDSGIGISEDQIEAIFDPFYQGDSGSRKQYGGMGLGLSLCKRLVAGLGGSMGVKSIPGKGTSFYFNIQASLISNYQIIPEDDGKFDLGLSMEYSILVVEDDPVSVSLLSIIFKKYKVDILIAKNGMEAIEILNQEFQKIRLVLMDLQMPIMDGFEASKRIRANDQFNHIPLIALTAFARNEDRLLCEEMGFSDYVSKPFSIDELIAKIKMWVKK